MEVAIHLGHIDVLRTLVTEGNVGSDFFKDELGMSAVCYAIENNRLDMVELLLKQGADLIKERGCTYRYSLNSPLELAAQLGYKNAVEMIYDEIQNRPFLKREFCASAKTPVLQHVDKA